MCDPFGYESEDIGCKFMWQKLFKVTWKLLTLMCAGSIKISFEDEGYNFLFEVIAAKIRIGGFRGNCSWFLTLTLHTIESAWPAWAEGGVKIVIEAKTFWAVESLLKQLSLSTLPSCLPTHMSSDVVLGSRAFKRKPSTRCLQQLLQFLPFWITKKNIEISYYLTIDIMRSRSPSLVQMTMVVILLGLLFADEVMSSPFIYSQEYCQLNPEYCKKRNAEIPGKVRVLHIVKKVTYRRKARVRFPVGDRDIHPGGMGHLSWIGSVIKEWMSNGSQVSFFPQPVTHAVLTFFGR